MLSLMSSTSLSSVSLQSLQSLDGNPGRQNLAHAAESSWCSLDLAVSMMCECWRGSKHHRPEAQALQGFFPSFAGEDSL